MSSRELQLSTFRRGVLPPSSRWRNIVQAFDIHQYRCQNFKCSLLIVTVNDQVLTHVKRRVEYVDMKLTEARKHFQLLSDITRLQRPILQVPPHTAETA